MATNELPKPLSELLDLSDTMVSALTLHEVAIGIKQNLAATVGPAATAPRTAVTAHGNAASDFLRISRALISAETAAFDKNRTPTTINKVLIGLSCGRSMRLRLTNRQSSYSPASRNAN